MSRDSSRVCNDVCVSQGEVAVAVASQSRRANFFCCSTFVPCCVHHPTTSESRLRCIDIKHMMCSLLGRKPFTLFFALFPAAHFSLCRRI